MEKLKFNHVFDEDEVCIFCYCDDTDEGGHKRTDECSARLRDELDKMHELIIEVLSAVKRYGLLQP